MEARTHTLRTTRITLASLSAALALVFLLAFLVSTHAAPLRNEGSGTDPRIQAITATSSLPISDTHPGDGITKTVYFTNDVPGVITLTFEISGTPTLTLTAGAAFDEPERVYTSTDQFWTRVVTYAVATTHTTQPNIIYTATNTNSAQTMVAITWAGRFRIYLPVVMRNYRPFANGDFESGLSGWNTGQGPFDGHGSGMDQSVVMYDASHRALLGETDAQDGSIHVGYGYIAQTFTVEKPNLQLQYRVRSFDIVQGTEQRYFDTLEVSVNRPPDQISDIERNTKECASTILNPEGTLTVSGDGLAFCGGRSGDPSDVGTQWDSGWRTVTLDLSAFQGGNITLYISIWSREYDSGFYDDNAWFNTWGYVDDLVPQD